VTAAAEVLWHSTCSKYLEENGGKKNEEDPARDIRSAIERDRAMIASGKIDWSKLIAGGESIGIKIEREPDLARQQEEDQQRGERH
jgi:hypothetical protein